MFTDVIQTIAVGFGTGLTAWFFVRRKNTAEAHRSEIETAQKSAEYYQQLIDDLTKRHKEAIGDLETAYDKIRQLEQDMQNLMIQNRQLLEELKKYKQLNGKS